MSITVNISEIRSGNRTEFGKLADENMDYIYKTALRIMANEEDARDMVQDTFLTVWNKRRSIKNSESLKPYLSKIVVNKCYDQLRRRKIRKMESRIEDESKIKSILSDEDPGKKLENDEAISLIRMLVSGLSPRQRIVFTMVELDEMSHDEVCELTGMKKNSIKSNLSHARKKLEEKLKDYLS
ncbi:MAG: sigma-70 family RNA polymerase sigma factor [Bacteroidales bacterium]|nr:sigma-70 family RNA polymerase sigma factor [Bacteroidales bacterium]